MAEYRSLDVPTLDHCHLVHPSDPAPVVRCEGPHRLHDPRIDVFEDDLAERADLPDHGLVELHRAVRGHVEDTCQVALDEAVRFIAAGDDPELEREGLLRVEVELEMTPGDPPVDPVHTGLAEGLDEGFGVGLDYGPVVTHGGHSPQSNFTVSTRTTVS